MFPNFSRYLEALHQKISTCCDTEHTIRRLKEGTIPKLEGWELLKKQTFTKLLLTLYSSSLLTLFVSVQLTIVSANIFQSMSSRGDDNPGTSGHHDNTTKVYLAKISHLLDYAIPEIHRVCESEVGGTLYYLLCVCPLMPEHLYYMSCLTL